MKREYILLNRCSEKCTWYKKDLREKFSLKLLTTPLSHVTPFHFCVLKIANVEKMKSNVAVGILVRVRKSHHFLHFFDFGNIKYRKLLRILKVAHVKSRELLNILLLEKNVKIFLCIFLPLLHIQNDTNVLGFKMNCKVT